MKNIICVFIALFLITFTYGQDPIKNYPGIPIVTHRFLQFEYIPIGQIEEVASAGIHTMIMDDLTPEEYDDYVEGVKGLMIVPTRDVITLQNPILNYTDARYTVFEAEGTPPADGLVTLYSDSLWPYLEKVDGYVRTKTNTPHGTMIYGPMYRQCRNFFTTGTSLPIIYEAKYILKIDDIDPWLESSPDDTVCILQVTATRTWDIDSTGEWHWGFFETKVAAETLITYGDLHPGSIDTVDLNYSFTIDFPWWRPDGEPFQGTSFKNMPAENDLDKKISQNCVEFKVLWKGKADKVRLSVDKVIISDDRGRDLKNPQTYASIKLQIENQISHNRAAFDNRVGLLMGVDEPWSIDQWEPIRMVQEIINSYSPDAKYYINFNVQAEGRFSHWPDPSPGSHAIVIDEFMRRVKKANLWVTGWLYDMPCSEATNFSPPWLCDENVDIRIRNIDIMADSIYKRVTDAGQTYPNLHYGFSIQTGMYQYSAGHYIREINSKELLYQSNLALLYGAKILFPWAYFGHDNGIDDNYTGFRNHQHNFVVTDKYNTLKDTIAPRLSNLLGKTLKKLKPTNQYAGSNGINALIDPENTTPHEFIDFIKATGGMNDTCYVELGFFEEPQRIDKKYFMPLNRYYSNCHNLRFGLRHLTGFINWAVTDYVDATNFTLVTNNGEAEFYDTIYPGDANLYSVAPVVKYGGRLLSSETIGSETFPELEEDLIVSAGVTLSIEPGAWLQFNNNAKLIVEGVLSASGSSSSKITFDFQNQSEYGIILKEGGSLNLNHTKIQGASTGVLAENGSGYVYIQNSEFIDCNDAGLVLFGSSIEGSSTPPPSTVYNCTINGSSNAILAVNYNEIVISQNEINNSDLGIYIAHIPSVHIQGNRIYGSSTSAGSGIFMESCGGYIRTNTITGHTNGIHLGNSSPDIGGNVLEHNKFHGLYIGYGSFPNMLGFLSLNPPYYFPLSGYNRIKENGMGIVSQNPDHNDGSEVYLYYSNALFGTERYPGCNQIADDRASTPTMDTELLISGEVLDAEIEAVYNYWGERDPSQSRFGELAVIFEPYYLDPCPVPEGGEGELIARTSSGQAVDTLYGVESTVTNYSEVELAYANANNHFIAGEMQQAKVIYQQIAQGEYSALEKLPAYIKLYTLGNINGEDESYFTALQNTFNDIALGLTDTLLMQVYRQKSILCDVSKQNYLTAITEFDNIIQQNPESEAAVYAEIDILTTSLKVDTTGSQLGKMNGGKYLVKGSSDYLSKMNGLLKDRFGINITENEIIVPKEYVLYQNYPNPFNPSTTIKFDLPKDGVVELGVYDILGRKITTLINEYRNAGSYEHSFNASSLASGIYLYRIQINDFVSAKKMILVK